MVHPTTTPDRITAQALLRGPQIRYAILLLFLSGVAALLLHDPSLLRRTQRVVLSERFTSGRLDRSSWNSCGRVDRSVVVPRAQCAAALKSGSPQAAQYARIAEAVGSASTSDSSPETLHATALVELRSAGAVSSALDRAVTLLERATRGAAINVSRLNDLAVAYIAVAERDQQLIPMLKALDLVDRALHQDSTYAPALFNRALILERLYLRSTAAGAWSRFIVRERGPWSDEARAHLRDISSVIVAGDVRQYPQKVREAFFADAGALGEALQKGDDRQAEDILGPSRVAADSLTRLGADGSLFAAVRWLDARLARRSSRQSIAQALAAFSLGIRLHDSGAYESADSVLSVAEARLRRLASPLVQWATFYRAASEANLSRYGKADRTLRRLIETARSAEPALTGKALWVRGTVQLRIGNYESANTLFAASRTLFLRAQDAKNDAATAFLLSESLELAGQSTASAAEAYRGLRDLAPFRHTPYLHNQLLTTAGFARSRGMTLAALDVMSEALSVDRELGRAGSLVLALWTRARDYAASGDSARAFADLDSATLVANSLAGRVGQRARADIAATRGAFVRFREPRRSMELLTRAIGDYRELRAHVRLPSALFELAGVAGDMRDTATQRAALVDAISLLERQNTAFTTADARAAFAETVERVFDAMIALDLDAHRLDSSFGYLERQRTIVWRKHASNALGVFGSLSSVRRVMGEDGLFVAYGVLADRVAIWSASRRGTDFRSVTIPRESLSVLVAQLSIKGSHGERIAEEARTRLFRLLLTPVIEAHSGLRQLWIVPDRELVTVPFASLRDGRSGRFLVEDFVVRTVPSAAFVRSAAGANTISVAHASALIIGNPALSDTGTRTLAPLPGADIEAKRIAALYRAPLVLGGSRATRGRVLAAISQYSIVHFAGHSVFDAERPELSYLALAMDSSGGSHLAAREIAHLRLSNVRLVVLSACSTLNARPTRVGSVAGLAFSFLRAGSPATVSTLWDVGDSDVSDLLVEFHTRVARGMDAASALRDAQMRAVKSVHVAARSPAVWGAFIYTGP